MRIASLHFVTLLSLLGIFGLNFVFMLPAKASISCEPGTINRYPNGSLSICILSQNTTLQISSASGISNFPCKAQGYIHFDDKGQFNRCQLAQEIQIIIGSYLKKCPAEFWVNVSTSNEGNISISCQQY